MYTISEFGLKTGVSTITLRFMKIWTSLSKERNSNGHRLYGLSELAILQQIKSL